jgi:stress response protein YsnF
MSEQLKIPVVEEEASIDKRRETSGMVSVTTRTRTFEAIASADLERSHVTVRRVTIEQEVDAVPTIREEGDTTIIPVIEEILVVEKRLVLKEEIHLTRLKTTEHVELPVTLRKQVAAVERTENANPNNEQGEHDVE